MQDVIRVAAEGMVREECVGTRHYGGSGMPRCVAYLIEGAAGDPGLDL